MPARAAVLERPTWSPSSAARFRVHHRAACRLPQPTQDEAGAKIEMVRGIGQKDNGRWQNSAGNT